MEGEPCDKNREDIVMFKVQLLFNKHNFSMSCLGNYYLSDYMSVWEKHIQTHVNTVCHREPIFAAPSKSLPSQNNMLHHQLVSAIAKYCLRTLINVCRD